MVNAFAGGLTRAGADVGHGTDPVPNADPARPCRARYVGGIQTLRAQAIGVVSSQDGLAPIHPRRKRNDNQVPYCGAGGVACRCCTARMRHGQCADQAPLCARRCRQRAADAVCGRSGATDQGAHQRPRRNPGVSEFAAGRRGRTGRRRQVGRDFDGPPRLRVAGQDPVLDRRVQYALRVPRSRAQPSRHRRALVARAARDQCAAGREGQHAHHRQLLPGHARTDVEGKGAVDQGHAGQEVSRRAGQAVVVDADRDGRGCHAGRGVRTRHRARHGTGRRAGKSACPTSTT